MVISCLLYYSVFVSLVMPLFFSSKDIFRAGTNHTLLWRGIPEHSSLSLSLSLSLFCSSLVFSFYACSFSFIRCEQQGNVCSLKRRCLGPLARISTSLTS